MTAPLSLLVEFGEGLVQAFAHATGDHSAIHMDAGFARQSRYRQRVVHGMLPVFCLLAAAGRELLGISCRFTAPVRLGESLALVLDAPGTDGWQALRIERPGGELASSGKVLLGGVSPAALATGAAALAVAQEAVHSPQTLAAGLKDSLDVTAGASSVAAVTALLPFAAASSPSLLALLPLSTLVGMRLPGRAATFTEFSVAFDRPVAPGAALTLEGTVDKLLAGGRRLQLAVAWRDAQGALAQGTASTLVNAAPPEALSCADIRAAHLGLGLAGRVALVTGASRGIGATCARLLALQGAVVAVHYFQGREDAQAVVDDITSAGGRAFAVGADLRDAAQVGAMFDQVAQAGGPLDILVNNAVGEFSPRPYEQTSAQDLQAELDVSLLGLHACCQQAVAVMRPRRAGRIVNLGTVATQLPASGQIRYVAAKSAVEGYTRALAAELAADNVQVNLVVPAMTRTSLLAALPEALVERLAGETPQGRLLEPIEVAQAVVLLCSDWTRAVSGQQLVLNQGLPPYL